MKEPVDIAAGSGKEWAHILICVYAAASIQQIMVGTCLTAKFALF